MPAGTTTAGAAIRGYDIEIDAVIALRAGCQIPGTGTASAGGAIGVNAVFGEVALPAMLMKQTALDKLPAVMSQYAADHGFVLAPHGKTTMAPKVFQRRWTPAPGPSLSQI